MKKIKYKTNKQVTSIEFSVDKKGYDFLFGLCEIFDLKDIFIDIYTAVIKEQDYKALSKVDNILIATADRNAKTKDIHLKATTENLLQITKLLEVCNFEDLNIWNCYTDWEQHLNDKLDYNVPVFKKSIVKQNECDFYLNFKEGVVEIICQPVDDIDEVLTQIQKII